MSSYMPAEWHPHAGTWLIWPHNSFIWRDNCAPVHACFIDLITAIASFEPVNLGVREQDLDTVRGVLLGEDGDPLENLHIHVLNSDDCWARDTGCTFVFTDTGSGSGSNRDGSHQLVGINWGFNNWGSKGLAVGVTIEADKVVAPIMATLSGAECLDIQDFILEGGSIHVDGEGTLLTTEECLLNTNRNPTMTRTSIERMLGEHLGVCKVLWLPRGLAYDEDTDGHIDNIACFVRPGVVLLSWCDDETELQYEISREAEAYLSSVTDAKGRSLEIIRIPVPCGMSYTQQEVDGLAPVQAQLPDSLTSTTTRLRDVGERIQGSYVNFVMTNGGIVMAKFDCPQDEAALKVMQKAFPERRVVQVSGKCILEGGGNLHCVTQQIPLPP